MSKKAVISIDIVKLNLKDKLEMIELPESVASINEAFQFDKHAEGSFFSKLVLIVTLSK